MVVYTMTKKQVLRIISLVLLGVIALMIGIFAVINAVSASAEDIKHPIYCVERGDNKIALTFDCAWGNSNTDELLEILKNANAKATFFVTGEFCDNYPEDVKKFYEAGHSVQNHSDLHPHVKGMNINDLIADTKECSRKIKMITGEEPLLYRAPYGEYDNNVMTTVEGMGLKVIQWNADSIDWEDPDPYTIHNRILSKTSSGSILLFHNDLENTTEALPQLLTELLQKGFEFTAVEDMIYFEDYYVDNNGVQIYAPTTSAITPVVLYAEDPYANMAFEKMRLNLTIDEIYNLSVFGELKLEVLQKNLTFLSRAEVAALYEMSYEELYAAYIALVYAAEVYGAKDYDPQPSTTTTAEPLPTETTTATTVPATTLGDKTDITASPDKTEIVTTYADKTEIVTTYADKTEIGSGYGDKTEAVGDKTEAVTTYGDKTETGTGYPDRTEIIMGPSSDTLTTTVTETDTTTEPSAVTTTASETEETTVAATTTTEPPQTTVSEDYDVQGEQIIITTKEPK